MMDMFRILVVVVVSQCGHMPKLIKLHTLNIRSLLHVNYTTIKLFFSFVKKKQIPPWLVRKAHHLIRS